MTKELSIEQNEEAVREAAEKALLREAAINVLDGQSRQGALDSAREQADLREDAQSQGQVFEDEDGFTESYHESDLNVPSGSGHPEPQIQAVANSLRDIL